MPLVLETIESAKSQTHRDLEILVVDDGSDPETITALAEAVTSDQRIEVILRSAVAPERKGAQVCRNIGIEQARGEYVLFLDSDDLLAPHCLEQRVQLLEADPTLDFCVSQGTKFEGQPKSDDPLWSEWKTGQDDLEEFLRGIVPWQTSGPLWRKRSLARVGRWDESLNSGQDYEYHVRALAVGAKYDKIHSVNYYWREPRADSISSKEGFNRQYREGSFLRSFESAIKSVEQHSAWTTTRREAAWKTAIRRTLVARHHNGDLKTVLQVLRTARASCSPSTFQFYEILIILSVWFRVRNYVPSLNYANLRGIT